jgi:hypothetical protein
MGPTGISHAGTEPQPSDLIRMFKAAGRGGRSYPAFPRTGEATLELAHIGTQNHGSEARTSTRYRPKSSVR